MRVLLLLIAAALVVSACGYKGPLYLPGSKPERKARPAAQQPAPAQDQDQKEETK